MRKIMFILAVAFSTSVATAGNPVNPVNNSVSEDGGKITLINDTDEKVKVYTGTGTVSLNPNGGKTSFSCDTGKDVKVNGKVIFTNDSDYCNETVKISDFM